MSDVIDPKDDLTLKIATTDCERCGKEITVYDGLIIRDVGGDTDVFDYFEKESVHICSLCIAKVMVNAVIKDEAL